MDCRTAHNHLSMYLDYAIPAPMREVVDNHLGTCPECRRELMQLQTVVRWLHDLPPIEPSPSLLQRVREQVEHSPRRSPFFSFRRLGGFLPLQMAAGVMLVVGTVLLVQMTSHVWQGNTRRIEPPARVESQTSRERTIPPSFEPPVLKQTPEELPPTPVPLVQSPAARPVVTLREEPSWITRDQAGMSVLAGLQSEPRANVILWATDPWRAAQQVSEIVQRAGGAVLVPWGTSARTSRVERGPVKVALSVAADRYRSFLDAIRQLSGTTLVEEHTALTIHEPWRGPRTSAFRPEHPHEALIPRLTLVITILPPVE